MEYEDNLIQLIDEDGEELNFEHIMTLDYKDKQYIVLTPADDEFFEGEDDVDELAELDGASEDDLEDFEEEGELIILEVSEDEEGNELFLSIEDDDLLDELMSHDVHFLQITESDILNVSQNLTCFNES
jgi:uncharacterized protein YrzB (UPF0473 family)